MTLQSQRLVGSIDKIANGTIHGWAGDKLDLRRKASVRAMNGSEALLIVAASDFRADLKEAGLSDGTLAFELKIPVELHADVSNLKLEVYSYDDELLGELPINFDQRDDLRWHGEKSRFSSPDFNRKNTRPSLAMYPSDGKSYYCPWILDSLTVHSDGNVSCGLDDPNALRSFGNIKRDSISKIWANREYLELDRNLKNGHRCRDCGLYTERNSDNAHRRLEAPTSLIVEPTIACNIRCLNDACIASNDRNIKTRDNPNLHLEEFKSLIDQLSKLANVYFFNYGDPFVNIKAEDMLAYLREQQPAVQVVTSTNGIPLCRDDRAGKVIAAAPDCIVVTIGGITPYSYSRYHQKGRVDQALAGLRLLCEAKRLQGNARTKIVWRYLLFRWNDSDKEIEDAIKMAQDFGVDQFVLYLTHMPLGASSFRFAPGTPNFERFRGYIDSALGFAGAAGVVEADDQGFFPLEEVADLGAARWSTWRSTITTAPRQRWINFSISTNQPSAEGSERGFFIMTPWTIYKSKMQFKKWSEISIKIPREFRRQAVDITILNLEPWYPADEWKSADLRCLGFLLQEKPRRKLKSLFKLHSVKGVESASDEEKSAIALYNRESGPRLIDHNSGRFGF